MSAADNRVLLPSSLTDPDCRAIARSFQRRKSRQPVVLDGSALGPLDSLGVARLLRLVAAGRDVGVEVRLDHLESSVHRALADADPRILEEAARPIRPHPLESLGARTLDVSDGIADTGELLWETGASLATPLGRRGIKWDRALQQMNLVGVRAVPIVAFVSLLIGVVLALNGAFQLRQFGATIFIANLVGISMTREMGPIITAVIVSGRTGSAIAAEIGAMKITEELDAMRTMALNPIRFVVAPKMLALVVMMPLLTVLSNVAGMLGGYLVGIAGLELSSDAYLSQTVRALHVSDVMTGLFKSLVFGLIVGVVGVRRGLAVRGGPEAVGLATTSAVVTAITLCIIANACFTAFFYYTR